jgi:hypothetical protein
LRNSGHAARVEPLRDSAPAPKVEPLQESVPAPKGGTSRTAVHESGGNHGARYNGIRENIHREVSNEYSLVVDTLPRTDKIPESSPGFERKVDFVSWFSSFLA